MPQDAPIAALPFLGADFAVATPSAKRQRGPSLALRVRLIAPGNGRAPIAIGQTGAAKYPPKKWGIGTLVTNIGIFLPNWLGDLVMATPMLRAMRRRFGTSARLVGVMRPYLADVLAGTGFLDEQWYFQPHAREPHLRHWSLVRRMRRERFDVAILLPNSFRAALLARLGGARERIGYRCQGRGPLLTKKLESPRTEGFVAESPMVTYYLKLAEAVGCFPESPRLELATLPRDDESADRVWESLGLRTDGRVAMLNSGSSNGVAKFWPADDFAQLGRRIAEELDHDVLVMCGPRERSVALEIVEQAKHPRVFSMAGQPLDLGTAKGCIRRGRVMVSTDSGPRHVAAAFGKPVVTLLGPTLPIWIENPTVVAVDLQLDLECIGCQNRVCPLEHHRCMRELTPDFVFGEVVTLLASSGGRQSATAPSSYRRNGRSAACSLHSGATAAAGSTSAQPGD